MKKNYLYLAALAMFTAACSNEDEFAQEGIKPSPEVKMITETIKASNGDNTPATRADIDADANFAWSVGDQIAVHVNNGQYYTTEALAEGDGGNATADFSVTYPEGAARDAFAVFPASIVTANAQNYGQENYTLDVTLPASYTLAQVSGTKTPCPMIATNTGKLWDFNQLCGMLRLTVNGISPSTSYLKIDFNGTKVQGSFSIASPVTPGTSVIETSATTDIDDDIITITGISVSEWTDGLVLNLPLPIGTYTDATITTYNSSDQPILTMTAVLAKTGASSYTAARAKGRKVTAYAPGLISVSATKKVVFAPGNLQYLGNADGTGTWRFAEHQYDFMGDGPSSGTGYQGNVTVAGYTEYNNSANQGAARDLFGWGTSGYSGQNPWITSTGSGSYYAGSLTDTDYDWGVYHSASGNSTEKITNGGNYSWRLFTSDEWAYVVARTGLVYTREDFTETKKLFAPATVVGAKGIILFPDNWNGSLCKSIIYGNDSKANYDKLICDAETWAKFEKQGCVFLPAAHVRSGTAMSNQNCGCYWASTVFSVLNNTELRGGTLRFSESGAVTNPSSNYSVRYLGQSVRLIREVE